MKKLFLALVFFCLPFALYAQQWEVVLPDSIGIFNGFIDKDNVMYYVGYSKNEESLAKGALVKIYDDGQYELKTFTDNDEKHLILCDVTPLTNGNFFLIGTKCVSLGTPGELVILILDDLMGVVYEQTIQIDSGFDGFEGGKAIIDDDGTIILFTIARRQDPYIPGTYQFNGVMFRYTQEGECLNYRYLIADYPDPLNTIYQITDLQLINDPYYNHTIALCPGKFGVESILHFDYDFNLLNDYLIEDPTPQWVMAKRVDYAQSDYWYNENEMLITCEQIDTIQGSHNHPHILVGRMNREGLITEQIQINKEDTLMYACQLRHGMAYANDSTIYILAKCNTEDWLEPCYPQIYLINKDLEILGCVSFWQNVNFSPSSILPTSDDGCVFVTYNVMEENILQIDTYQVRRLGREDFHPVWSIKEKPKNIEGSKAFPNPAQTEIHFDLTDVPLDGSVRLCITNTNGQTYIDRIICGSGNLLTVGIETLPSGVYTYRIYTKDKVIANDKFIKE